MRNLIWVIDDDPIYRMIISHNIRTIAPESAIVEHDALVELVQMMEDGRFEEIELPDYIFLDINLPEIDAWVFLEKITEDQHIARMISAKIIVVSSSINPKDKSRAMRCPQVVSFESKPLSKERILQIISNN